MRKINAVRAAQRFHVHITYTYTINSVSGWKNFSFRLISKSTSSFALFSGLWILISSHHMSCVRHSNRDSARTMAFTAYKQSTCAFIQRKTALDTSYFFSYSMSWIQPQNHRLHFVEWKCEHGFYLNFSWLRVWLNHQFQFKLRLFVSPSLKFSAILVVTNTSSSINTVLFYRNHFSDGVLVTGSELAGLFELHFQLQTLRISVKFFVVK